MKSGLLFSRFFKALIGAIDFQTIGIKLSLKITNRTVEKISSAILAFALQIFASARIYSSRNDFINFSGFENLNRGFIVS